MFPFDDVIMNFLTINDSVYRCRTHAFPDDRWDFKNYRHILKFKMKSYFMYQDRIALK